MESKPFSWRSSELWVAIASGIGTIITALGWVPWETWEKVLYPAVTYIIARVTGKTAKAIVPLLLGMTILSLTLAAPLYAQQSYPIGDWRHRTQVSFSSGYLQYNETQNTEAWRGVDLAGSLTYTLHPQLSLYGIYGHAFPLDGRQGHDDQARFVGNLLVYPDLGTPRSAFALWAGAGLMWRGSQTLKHWTGGEAHLALTGALNDRVGAFVAYYHGFAFDAGQRDIDYLRAGLNARVLP